jgi:lipopolysaccharide/colanic/teichoic acid biosynthesis glycosyltransferase
MKRFVDLVLVVASAPIWFPLLVLAGIAVRVKVGSPVFFRQERPGLRGKIFPMTKFRTMTDDRDAAGRLLPDKDRLVPFGRWMRSTSLDELPELLNVLRGEMSLVGPRPLLVRYLGRYSPEQARRHEVRPGITGWAQVNGRNAISWEEKFKLDVWYVDHQTLSLDVKILWMTLRKVFVREGISADGDATMPEFMGTTRTPESEVAGDEVGKNDAYSRHIAQA